MYYRDLSTKELGCGSYCAISDQLKHNQTTVHSFLTKSSSLTRNNLAHITNIKYFTDEAASQQKNFKAIINLAFHFHGHKLTAEQNIFATLHGKSPCDGMVGLLREKLLMPV